MTVDSCSAPVVMVSQREAARITNLSAKTLGRLADAGEPVGRMKIGGRVVYHLPTLTAWCARRAEPQMGGQ